MGRIRLSSKKQYKPYPIELYLRCKHNSHNKAEETESMKGYKSGEKPSLFLLPRNASALRGNSLSLRSLRHCVHFVHAQCGYRQIERSFIYPAVTYVLTMGMM